jgi:hypothetical protein
MYTLALTISKPEVVFLACAQARDALTQVFTDAGIITIYLYHPTYLMFRKTKPALLRAEIERYATFLFTAFSGSVLFSKEFARFPVTLTQND